MKADFVHLSSPITSTWVVDHSKSGAETGVSSCWRVEEGGEALSPSPLHTPANFPASSCPEGPLQTGEQIEVVVFPLAVMIGGSCDVDPCPGSSGLG